MGVDLEALYIDLHQNPELSFQEVRTSQLMAGLLRDLGYEVIEGIGVTGLTGILRNGDGPVVWLRADMDALPVEEQTGLPYASTAKATDPDGKTVSVMHACGHDLHMTAMIGAAERLAAERDSWSGTVVIIMQPAEEFGDGARTMLDDGFANLVPHPDIVLAQHQTTLPAGRLNLRPGTQMAGCDTMRITLYGRGGHGSKPEATVDPIVLAAATIMRLQTIPSRLIDPREVAVVTVGAIHSGTKSNIIPADAVLDVSIRHSNDETRAKIIEHVERIVKAEALASGAEREPLIEHLDTLPPTINDEAAALRVIEAFRQKFGDENVVSLPMSTGSEDASWFARDTGAPLVYWYWGSWDPEAYARAEAADRIAIDVPTNHSPFMGPVIHPTIEVGVEALTTAAREFLGESDK